jgi:hypothetical protein
LIVQDLPEAFPENGGFSWICQASFCMFTFIVWDVFLIVYGILSSLNSASDAIFLESKQLNETMYGNPWGGHHTFRKMIYYVGKAIINHSPSHHFSCGINHSQSWGVDDIVLPTFMVNKGMNE